MPQQASSQQVNSNNMYQHQLDGEWDYVVGHFGFFHEFPEVGNAFVSIFGARTTPNGNGTHNTNEWDRKAFWFDVGDGVPMHLGAEYYVEYIDPEDESFSVIVYNAYNLLYRQNGKDYSQTEFGGEWIYLELYTDLNSDYIDYSILLLDENDEVVEVRKFELGDQVEAWTAVYKLDEPESVYVTSMEEDFRMIQSEPVFMYEHMTPNVDFPNALTQDIVDFPNVELKLALFGVNLQDNAATPFQFSSVKDVGVKWDGAIVTGIVNWVLHWFE